MCTHLKAMTEALAHRRILSFAKDILAPDGTLLLRVPDLHAVPPSRRCRECFKKRTSWSKHVDAIWRSRRLHPILNHFAL